MGFLDSGDALPNAKELQAQIAADPQIQAAIAHYNDVRKAELAKAGGNWMAGAPAKNPAMASAAHDLEASLKNSSIGHLLPANYHISNAGELQQNSWLTPQLVALMVGGGLVGAGAIASAGGAGAAPTAAIPTEAVATGAATGAEAAGIPVAGSSLSATIPALTAPVASGAATGAETAGVPVVGSTAAPLPGVAGGTGAFDSAGNWIPDASTNATAPAANASTGSTSWLDTAKDVGKIATDISGGRAKGREAESNINNNADRTLVDLYRTQVDANTGENNYGLNSTRDANSYGLNAVNAGVNVGNLDIAQKDYALAAPGKRAGNSVRGDILANAQDVSIDQPNIPKTTISGGLRPSMFSANTRELGGLLSSQALAQQKAGDTFAPLPKVSAYQPPPAYKPPPAAPTLTGPSQSNGFDTGLNAVGYASLGADLLAKYGKYFA